MNKFNLKKLIKEIVSRELDSPEGLEAMKDLHLSSLIKSLDKFTKQYIELRCGLLQII